MSEVSVSMIEDTTANIADDVTELKNLALSLLAEVEELTLRYKVASGLALSWGNYADREALETAIDEILADHRRAKC
jgi:hypothetical protein